MKERASGNELSSRTATRLNNCKTSMDEQIQKELLARY